MPNSKNVMSFTIEILIKVAKNIVYTRTFFGFGILRNFIFMDNYISIKKWIKLCLLLLIIMLSIDLIKVN